MVPPPAGVQDLREVCPRSRFAGQQACVRRDQGGAAVDIVDADVDRDQWHLAGPVVGSQEGRGGLELGAVAAVAVKPPGQRVVAGPGQQARRRVSGAAEVDQLEVVVDTVLGP